MKILDKNEKYILLRAHLYKKATKIFDVSLKKNKNGESLHLTGIL